MSGINRYRANLGMKAQKLDDLGFELEHLARDFSEEGADTASLHITMARTAVAEAVQNMRDALKRSVPGQF